MMQSGGQKLPSAILDFTSNCDIINIELVFSHVVYVIVWLNILIVSMISHEIVLILENYKSVNKMNLNAK